MNTLKNYLNSLDRKAQADYAIRCGTTIGYLRKAISKKQKFDGCLCRLLDEESNGAVNKGSLRPDIWPELANTVSPSESEEETTEVGEML